MKWTTTRLWLLSPLISSCAAAPAAGRSFDAPPERVRLAVRAALAEYPDVAEDGGAVTTGWGPERVSGEQGFLLGHGYRYRDRHRVTVAGSAVEVRSVVERRAPGGPRANRWERVDPAPAEKALLDTIAKGLEKAP